MSTYGRSLAGGTHVDYLIFESIDRKDKSKI